MDLLTNQPDPSRSPLGSLRADIPAGIVVLFVAVPLCLGIALASGAPLFSGLIAGIIGGVVVGILSGSALGVSGPAAGLAVVVFHAIEDLGFEPFLVAVVLGGLIQIALGFLRAGVLGYFFPSSVIKGMLAGIGVIIILKQIPHAFGYDSDPEGELAFLQPDGNTTFTALNQMLTDIDGSATLVALVSLFILVFWDSVLSKTHRVFRLVQGPLVVVAFGIAFQALATKFAPTWALSGDHLVRVPVAASFEEFKGLFQHPDWSALSKGAVWITAITLAVVASLETLLCVEATDKLDPLKRVTPTNRELLAQGVGNTVAGLIGGLPITQVIVRSSANIQSGGRTKAAAILHGLLLCVFVVALPNLLNLIPLSALAAILIVVGFKLAKPALFRSMLAAGGSQFVPFVVTVLGIVFTDLLTGIGLGLAVALFVLLRRSYANSHCLHMDDESVPAAPPGSVTMRLAEEVTFLNKGAIMRALKLVPDGSHLVIDASHCTSIDHDVLEVIDEFLTTTERRNITVQRIGEFVPGHQTAQEVAAG